MTIASVSFSAALPTYTSTGSNGTVFAKNTIAAQGDVTVSTNGAPASSGKATVVASDLTANGLNYTAQGATISGSQLTIYYDVSGNTNATQDQTLQATDQSAALTSGLYGSGITITPEGSQTNGSTQTTAYEISLNAPGNTTGTVNSQIGYSVSNSGDGSSLSLQGISSFGDNGLEVTYQLSDPTPAASAPTAPATGNGNTGNLSLQNAPANISTIGDLLASSNGFSFSGSLTNVFQAQSALQSTGPGNTLASVLSSGVNVSSGTSFQIADFLNTSPSAFPTSAATNSFAPSSSSSSTSSGNDNSSNSQSQAQSGSGVYSSLSDAGTSTIRGGNLNVVA